MLTVRDKVKQALFVPYIIVVLLHHFWDGRTIYTRTPDKPTNNAMDVLRSCEEHGGRVEDV